MGRSEGSQSTPERRQNAAVGYVEYEGMFRMAISGLSWAVGFIEGIGQGTDNYAAKTLARLSEPPRFVPGTEPTEAEIADAIERAGWR